jgi:hypothetical protein
VSAQPQQQQQQQPALNYRNPPQPCQPPTTNVNPAPNTAAFTAPVLMNTSSETPSAAASVSNSSYEEEETSDQDADGDADADAEMDDEDSYATINPSVTSTPMSNAQSQRMHQQQQLQLHQQQQQQQPRQVPALPTNHLAIARTRGWAQSRVSSNNNGLDTGSNRSVTHGGSHAERANMSMNRSMSGLAAMQERSSQHHYHNFAPHHHGRVPHADMAMVQGATGGEPMYID